MLDDEAELQRISTVIQAGPFQAEWSSLQQHTTPRWYQNGKFGIFIHWSLTSVPAFGNEWYSRSMYQEGTPEWTHHRETYGPQTEFGYKDFIGSFTNERFDPDDWAALFRRAGAQFVVPVAEHHDGFAMYDSDRSEWTAAKMGPRRDLFGDLATSVRRLGMVFGGSSHRAEHWFFMNGGMRSPSDVQDPAFADFYGPAQREETQPDEAYLDDWFLRTIEVVDRYRPEGCGSTGGSNRKRSSRTCANSPRTTTTPPSPGAERSRSTTSGPRSPPVRPSTTSSVVR